MTREDGAEFKDFTTFMRFFSTRMIQAVVQARMGKMQAHPCSPNPEQSNYFNLIIDEIGEIAAYLKSTVGKNYPPAMPVLTLEFILYTAGGDSLPMEAWVIHLNRDSQDCSPIQAWSASFRTTFYHQLSTLLRSMVVASRFTPTYRHYVCNQGPETYVIMYRVYEGEPDLSQFGEERKFKRLGNLPSPFGTLAIDLHFRTKMEICPQPFVEERTTGENIMHESANRAIPLAVTVPPEGSEFATMSPVSAQNINLFSTSPMSQDLPFIGVSPNSNLTRSVSFANEMGQQRPHSTNSADSKSQPQKSSPHASNSFPQRTSAHNRLRMRNNSFPFSSLLLESQSSSQGLPKLSEGDALNSSKSDAAIQKQAQEKIRRNSSLLMDGIGSSASNSEMASDRPSSALHGKVIFACDEGDEDEPKKAVCEDLEEEEEQSSDDSYVKVMAFAEGTSSEEFGTDLGEFVKEVKLAPADLNSFCTEPVLELEKQVNEFKEKEANFCRFVSGLREEKGSDDDQNEEY